MKLSKIISILELNDSFFDSSEETKITAINNTISTFEYESSLLDSVSNTLNIGVEKYKTKSFQEIERILFDTGYSEEEIKAIFNYTLHEFEVDFVPSLSYLSEFATITNRFNPSFTHEIHHQTVDTITMSLLPKTTYNDKLLQEFLTRDILNIAASYRVQDNTYILPSMSFSPTVTYLLSEVIP